MISSQRSVISNYTYADLLYPIQLLFTILTVLTAVAVVIIIVILSNIISSLEYIFNKMISLALNSLS